ncbi:MAG: hypothetical protein GOMPHAMPRED_003380 [Gomphillus americanus]|uniref:Uncharacterized protein n=1 Tax=Gomphillus americanus TaxID=1940652 RepID=A0A8H3EFI3_9LECA|nr:MAG: hypothetical protein GOMPHAMPRED_003380 [Gomphillus americanus]
MVYRQNSLEAPLQQFVTAPLAQQLPAGLAQPRATPLRNEGDNVYRLATRVDGETRENNDLEATSGDLKPAVPTLPDAPTAITLPAQNFVSRVNGLQTPPPTGPTDNSSIHTTTMNGTGSLALQHLETES